MPSPNTPSTLLRWWRMTLITNRTDMTYRKHRIIVSVCFVAVGLFVLAVSVIGVVYLPETNLRLRWAGIGLVNAIAIIMHVRNILDMRQP